MKNMEKTTTTILALILLSLTANFTAARDLHRDDDRRFTGAADRDRDDDHGCRGDRRCVSAPEIDPAQALGALTLLGGTIAIVRGHRRRKK
jgi:hypothetical protein